MPREQLTGADILKHMYERYVVRCSGAGPCVDGMHAMVSVTEDCSQKYMVTEESYPYWLRHWASVLSDTADYVDAWVESQSADKQ